MLCNVTSPIFSERPCPFPSSISLMGWSAKPQILYFLCQHWTTGQNEANVTNFLSFKDNTGIHFRIIVGLKQSKAEAETLFLVEGWWRMGWLTIHLWHNLEGRRMRLHVLVEAWHYLGGEKNTDSTAVSVACGVVHIAQKCKIKKLQKYDGTLFQIAFRYKNMI